MLKSFKYRLYPNNVQATLINKHIGAFRFVYNLALETKNYAYASHREKLSCFALINQLTELKKECIWLNEIDSQSLQQSVINLDKAFTQFFKGAAEFPKFKSKHNGSQSFRTPQGRSIRIENGKLYQPKFKEGIRILITRQFKGIIKNTTISRTPTGKYYVSVLVDTKKDTPSPKVVKEKTAVGIDLGLSHFIITSNGIKIDNPKYFKDAQKHLGYLQRKAHKKVKGSNNQRKAYAKVALQYEKVYNQRKDFLHKLSTEITNQYDTICLEDLNITGMVKNHKLARAISDAGWGMFVQFCKYKSEWKGKTILQIPTFEPSSKVCNLCGYVNHGLTLVDREWDCPCGEHHDRDINAAKVIKSYCLKNCGGLHRKKSVELPTMVGAMKQKVIKVKTL